MWAFSGAGAGAGAEPETFFCMNSVYSALWLSFDMLKGVCTLRIGIYFYVNIFWGWGWGWGLSLSLSPGHLFLYGFEFFIFAAFIQYAERHVSFKSWHMFPYVNVLCVPCLVFNASQSLNFRGKLKKVLGIAGSCGCAHSKAHPEPLTYFFNEH